MLCHVDIHENSREDSATFNFHGITWERAKGSGEFIFQAFTEPKIQNLSFGGHHGAASQIYVLRYKTLSF